MALLDFSNALDSNQNNTLETKIFDLSFDGSIKKLPINYISNRIQKVCVNNTTSEEIELGTVVGALLLKIFCDDILQTIAPNCQILQYADDTMLYTTNEGFNKALF